MLKFQYRKASFPEIWIFTRKKMAKFFPTTQGFYEILFSSSRYYWLNSWMVAPPENPIKRDLAFKGLLRSRKQKIIRKPDFDLILLLDRVCCEKRINSFFCKKKFVKSFFTKKDLVQLSYYSNVPYNNSGVISILVGDFPKIIII